MKNSTVKKLLLTLFNEACIYVLLLLSFSVYWCTRHFGNISMNEIMFTLNMPLKGTPNEYYHAYFSEALLPSLGVYFILKILCIILRSTLNRVSHCDIYLNFKLFVFRGRLKITGFIRFLLSLRRTPRWLLPTAWFLILVCITNSNYQLVDYLKSCIQSSDFIEKEYVDAKDIRITFPQEKKNLICIFVESAETTFQDKENGGIYDENLIPEMTALAKNNISFSQSELLDGAAVAPGSGWTIAGLVAQTSGIPLKLYTYGPKTDNRMGNYEYFLPGAFSIGEILAQQGYHNFFMAGSDFSFGGRTEYFTQHGNYEIWDYYSAVEEGKVSEDYRTNWGFEDQKLYEFAKEKLLYLAEKNQPFHFSMLTVDTHANGGDDALCELCPSKFESQYANVWACASAQLSDFINWLQKQNFYDNTVIYIAGDHSSMQGGDFAENYTYDKHNGSTERNVYNAFINAAAQPSKTKNRKFTTLDFCPSILGALGADIEGNRIGLGTNLFSEEQTLPEKYGYDEMFEELSRRSSFYNQKILYP